MAIIQATSDNLNKHLEENKDKLVVLNFWATWCGPCRMFHPQLEMLDDAMKDKIRIIKVDVDQNPDVASEYGVMGIPHTRLIKNEKIEKPMVGFMPCEQLQEKINTYL